VSTVLDRVFDAPLDIRSASEARQALRTRQPSWISGVLATKGIEWALARGAASRLGTRVVHGVGVKVGRRYVLPVTVAVDVASGARDGLREMQILASFLMARLEAEGLPVERDLVRRTTCSLYLHPLAPPDFTRSAASLSRAIGQRWAAHAVPVPGSKKRRRNDAEGRIDALARLDVARVVQTYRRQRPIIIDVPSREMPAEPPPPPPAPADPPALASAPPPPVIGPHTPRGDGATG